MPTKPVCGVGVDAGSDWTRVVAVVLEDGRVRLAGAAETRSQGWEKSRIADAKGVVDSIRTAIQEAERRAQTPIESAVLGAGGLTVGCGASRGGQENSYPRKFGQRDLDLVLERASRVEPGVEQMSLHICVRDFSVDGNGGVRDPRGRSGSRLEAFVNVITFSEHEYQALLGAAHQAELIVEEIVFEAMAAAYACLGADRRRGGGALLDIGADSTDLIVYRGDAVVLAHSLPVAGAYFTRDVARGLEVAWEEAEAVKLQHGCALRGLSGDGSLIEVPVPFGRPPREMPRSELSFILEARAVQLFRLVRRELVSRGLCDELLGGVLLCGGMARLNGMCDVAEQVLQCEAGWGLPTRIRDWPANLVDPAWTTAAGLAMYSARLKQREMERPRRGLLSKIFG